jgi:hypothetical protein
MSTITKGKILPMRAFLRILLSAGLITSIIVFVPSPAKAAVSTNGLVLHLDAGNSSSYSGSGNAWNDLSGSGNNGTLQGATYSSLNGQHIAFNGSNQYVSFGNITSNFSSGFSASFYANFGGTTQNWERLLDIGRGQATDNILIARSNQTNLLTLELFNGTTSAGYCQSSSDSILNNAWAHYAITLDGSRCRMYRNGIEIYSQNYSGLPSNVTRTLNYLGRSNWAADGYFDSGIGEISLYTRAISATEVWQNFRAQSNFCASSIGSSGTTRFISITAANSCIWTVPSGVTSLGYLVVAGGGGGGGANANALGGGGGGGAGEFLESTTATVTPLSSFILTVGTGGGGGAVNTRGGSGSQSSLIATNFLVTATGGEGGEGSPGIGTQSQLSGDGGRYATGGSNTSGASEWDGGGGGGGSGSAGFVGTDIGGDGGSGGAGGTGRSSSISQSGSFFAAGGGGGGTPSSRTVSVASQTNGFGGLGGSSIGGNGGVVDSGRTPATAAVANTGSGGGGGGWNGNFTNAQRAGGAGADGIILFRFIKSTGTVSSISITSNAGADSQYTFGETITVTVVFSETVTITGTPRIPVQGLSSKFFTYSSGSDSSAILFSYVVGSSDLDTDGISISTNSLELNSGSIIDLAGLAMTITHSAINASTLYYVDGRLIGSVTAIFYSTAPSFRSPVTITVTVSIVGNVQFRANGVKISNCVKRAATGTSPNITATCIWKPSVRGNTRVTATLTPTNGSYSAGSLTNSVFVTNRSGGR